MNQQTNDQKILVGFVIILSGLALMIGPFVVPLAQELEPIVRLAIAFTGFVDLIIGIAFMVMGQRGR